MEMSIIEEMSIITEVNCSVIQLPSSSQQKLGMTEKEFAKEAKKTAKIC